MQKIGEEISMVNKVFLVATLAVCLVAILPISLLARVAGPCANCHTMHNSQNGATQVFAGEGASWDGSNLVGTGATTHTPLDNLLKTDCIGCHSSTGADAYIALDAAAGFYVPIVWNINGYPANALAGGNFYGVAAGNDSFGHNVYGVGPAPWTDQTLLLAPGTNVGIGCANSCHRSLGLATSTDGAEQNSQPYEYNGCRGCHIVAGNGGAHHSPTDGSYRMLKGHIDSGMAGAGMFPQGIEDKSQSYSPGWEAEASSSRHNVYENFDYTADLDKVTIGRWCSGCHGNFHAMGEDDMLFPNINAGDTDETPLNTPWLRHPNDVVIPTGNPLRQHDYPFAGDNIPYNPNIPVGQDTDTYNTISAGDQVICLSCHRAHASEYPDALRWPNYATMDAHTTGPNDPTGCFFLSHRKRRCSTIKV